MRPFLLFLLLVAVMGTLLVSAMLRNSATADEGSFLSYGQQILETHTTKRFEPFHNSKMPVNALQALPAMAMKDRMLTGIATTPQIQGGRLISVLFTLLLGFFLIRWSHETAGTAGAVLAAALFAFSPNVLAHGNLLTTDMPLACMVFLSLYYFAKLWKEPCRANFFKSALVTGLAQWTKFTALHLLPLFAGLALWRYLRAGKTRPRAGKFFGGMFLYGVLVWALLNTGFLWEGMFHPMRDFVPEDFPRTQGVAGDIPVPFAHGFFQGLVMTARDDSPYPDWLYLAGKHSKERFAWYFPLALLWKTPLGVLALFALALLWRPKVPDPSRPLILATMLYLFLYFTLCHGHQIGLRFLLPLFPLAHLLISQIAAGAAWQKKTVRVVCTLLAIFAMGSSLSYYPHFIPYFNESIGNRLNAHRYLGDSNLDWNQANWHKEQYLRENPGFDPETDPMPGTKGHVLLRANDVIGIQDPERYRWLRENHDPVGHIAHAWLIYDL